MEQAQRRQRGTDWSAAAAPSRSGRLTHKKGGERFIDQKKRPAATEGSPSEAAAPHKKQGTQVAAPEPQPRQTQVQRRRSGHVAMKGPKGGSTAPQRGKDGNVPRGSKVAANTRRARVLKALDLASNCR